MKSPSAFFACLFFIFITACSSPAPAELVIGRWKIEDVTQSLPNVDPKLKAYYEDQLKTQNADLLQSGFYEFREGGQGFFELNGERTEGKWRLSEDNKKIFFKEKGDTEEVSYDIREITESLFVFEVNEAGQSIRITMKKKA